jgi:hypothetical protein
MRLRLSAFAIAVLTPLAAFAQEPPPAAPAAAPPAEVPAAPAPAPAAEAAAPAAAPAPVAAAAPAKSWKDLVTIDGLVDAYYMAYLNPPSGPGNSLTPTANRQFDVNSNTFTLNYAKLGIGVNADNVGLRIDMGYGAMGNLINGFPGPGIAPVGSPAALGAPFVVQQAYATLTPVDNLTIDFGKFVTTAGAEVIEANKNWLYSRSLLFFNIPLVHTGLRAGYKVNDMVSVQGSVVNGWNGQGFEVDTNSNKTFGASASITAPNGLSVIPTIYFGKEFASTSWRFLGDLVAAYTMGPLGLNFNFDFVKDSNIGPNPFFGVAGMGRYSVNDHFAGTLRGEFTSTKSAAGAKAQAWEVTLGGAVPMAGRFEFRPEFRYDGSDQTILNGKKSQLTLLGAFLAWF